MQANPLKPFIFIELAAMTLLAFCYVEIEGAFSRHMLIHISLMTVIAPILASLLLKLRYSSAQSAGVATLFSVIVLQTALLFAWYSPPGIGLAMTGYSGALLMQASLFFAALWFWQTIFSQTIQPNRRTCMTGGYSFAVDRQIVLFNCCFISICAACALRYGGFRHDC